MQLGLASLEAHAGVRAVGVLDPEAHKHKRRDRKHDERYAKPRRIARPCQRPSRQDRREDDALDRVIHPGTGARQERDTTIAISMAAKRQSARQARSRTPRVARASRRPGRRTTGRQRALADIARLVTTPGRSWCSHRKHDHARGNDRSGDGYRQPSLASLKGDLRQRRQRQQSDQTRASTADVPQHDRPAPPSPWDAPSTSPSRRRRSLATSAPPSPAPRRRKRPPRRRRP